MYILLIVIYGGYSVTSQQISGYTSVAKCELAAAVVQKPFTSWAGSAVKTVCIPKNN